MYNYKCSVLFLALKTNRFALDETRAITSNISWYFLSSVALYVIKWYCCAIHHLKGQTLFFISMHSVSWWTELQSHLHYILNTPRKIALIARTTENNWLNQWDGPKTFTASGTNPNTISHIKKTQMYSFLNYNESVTMKGRTRLIFMVALSKSSTNATCVNLVYNLIPIWSGTVTHLSISINSCLQPIMQESIMPKVRAERHLSRNSRKPTKWPLRPANLDTHPVWSDSSLSASRNLGLGFPWVAKRRFVKLDRRLDWS